jgi:flagellar hook-associated protein 3 FlgL
MKTTFISSQAVSQALRYQIQDMQQDLTTAQKEVTTGKLADPGLTLGSRTGQAVSLSRDVDRLNGLVDSNSVISTRLTATQDGLGQLASVAQSFLSSLTAASTGDVDPAVVQAAGQSALDSATSVLNTNVNGEYIFAGINTDVKPINDFTAGSPARTALDNAFQSYFGFGVNDPQAADITADQITDFIKTDVEPQFLGAGWQGTWSNASDQPITSRISLNDATDTSVSANSDGTKKLMMASAMVADLFAGNLNSAARSAVAKEAVSYVGAAATDITSQQSTLGITQNRVSDASDRLKGQVDLFTRNLQDLEGVDPYEASTKITSLLTQIETSYSLTARIQNLSLVNFL